MGLVGSRWLWAGAILLVLVIGALLVEWSWSDTPDRLFTRADAAFRSGDLAVADGALRDLERLRFPNPVDRLLRAEVAASLGREQEAIDEFAAIGEDTPIAPLARWKAGDIELKRGHARRAEADFLAAIRLFPRSTQPRKQLAFLYSIQRRQAELDVQLTALMEQGALNFAYALHWTKTRNVVWNPRSDVETLEKFVTADPDDRSSRLALVEALRRLDRLDEAERWISPLPETDADARAARVSLRMDRGDFPGAQKLLADGPAESAALARLRGQLAIQQNRAQEAVPWFRIALASDAVDRLALSGLGTALLLLGDRKGAEPYLETARHHDALHGLVARAATVDGERDPKLPHELGMACAAVGRTAEARAWLRLAIERDPLDSEGQRVLYELEHRPASGPKPGPAGTAASPPSAEPPPPKQSRKQIKIRHAAIALLAERGAA
jgi:tetratricopeptide (TPR) repeat protein